jgi:hypothetical protein
VPHHVLVGFMRAACRRVVPHGLVGGKHNWAAFSRHLSLLLREPHTLAGDALTAQLLHGIRTSECAWLRTRTSTSTSTPGPPRHAPRPPPCALRAERRLLGRLLFFLYQRVVLPLSRRLFVRGTTQGGGSALHYWPRGVWLRLRRLALRRTKAVALRLLPAAEAREVLRSAGRALGVSAGRVLPKASELLHLVLTMALLPWLYNYGYVTIAIYLLGLYLLRLYVLRLYLLRLGERRLPAHPDAQPRRAARRVHQRQGRREQR